MLPLLLLILGGIAQSAVRQRSRRAAISIGLGATALTMIALLLQQDAAWSFSLWRPIERFGTGFAFRMDSTIWPFTVLCGAILLSQQLSARQRRTGLLQGALILATLMAANLLTAIVFWAALPFAGRPWSRSNGASSLRRAIPAILAIVPLMAAGATMGAEASAASAGAILLISAAAMLRLWGMQADSDVLDVLPSLALIARFGTATEPSAGLVAIGAATVLSWI
jgi:hypothetical protein